MKKVLLSISFIILLLQLKAQYGEAPNYYVPSSAKGNYAYDFTVILKDKSMQNFKSKILFDRKKESYYLKNKKVGTLIYPEQTREISRKLDNNISTIGYSHNNSWLFPIIKGKINCLSTNAETDEIYITHFQKDGDTIIYKFSNKDSSDLILLKMLSDNNYAFKMMEKSIRAKKTRKIIGYSALGSWISFIVGAALSAYIPPFEYLSLAGVFAIAPTTFIAYPIIFGKPQKRRMKAIKIYDSFLN